MRTSVSVVCLSLIACFSSAFAQRAYSDRCRVTLVEIPQRINSSNIENANLPIVELGTFDTVIYEEESTTRAYRLPGTRLFVVANVFYTDESMAGENSQDSTRLNLSISRMERYDMLSSLQHAGAEVLEPNSEVARVGTMFRYRSRRLYLIMECRKHS